MPRTRFSGSDGDLQLLLEPHMTSASYLPTGKLSGKYVTNNAKDMVKDVFAAQSNGALKKSQVLAVHKTVFDLKHSDWGLARHVRDEWARSMTDRLRSTCRFAAQALCKPFVPEWAVALGIVCETDENSDGEDEFVYGWDSFLQKAWRGTAEGSEVKDKEFALKLEAGDDESAPPLAVFKDGEKRPVAELTSADLAVLGDRPPAKQPSKFVEIGRTADGQSVRVGSKADRNPLMVVTLNSEQVCQVRIDLFQGGEAEAKTFMTDLGKLLVSGTVQKPQLYQSRDTMLTTRGLAARTRKRPAVTTASVPSSVVVKKRPAATPVSSAPVPENIDEQAMVEDVELLGDTDLSGPEESLLEIALTF